MSGFRLRFLLGFSFTVYERTGRFFIGERKQSGLRRLFGPKNDIFVIKEQDLHTTPYLSFNGPPRLEMAFNPGEFAPQCEGV